MLEHPTAVGLLLVFIAAYLGGAIGWFLAHSQPADETYGPTREQRRRFAHLAFLAPLWPLVVTAWFARRIRELWN